jgi:hypothetical protein
MYRHMRQSCKRLINGDSPEQDQKAPTDLNARLEAMTAMMQQMVLALAGVQGAGPAVPASVQHNNVQINAPVVTNNFVIQGLVPWDGPQRIRISVEDVLEVFASNPRLVEYSKMREHEMTDPVNIPYAAELFTKLAIRAHDAQNSRNIYLDPNRSDQAMVYLEVGNWAAAPLMDAIRLIFDVVAAMLSKIVTSDVERLKFPPEQQNAISFAEMMYHDDPLAYVKAAKAPLVSHLINCRAGRVPALRAR